MGGGGIIVDLPFCCHPVCLPVLFRLWGGKGTATPVEMAGELLSLLTQAFDDRQVHGVGDAAYHGRALLVAGSTFTTRLPVNAALYAPAPPRTGRRGRPRLKGERLAKLADLATTGTWRHLKVTRYGRDDTVQISELDCIWYGAFGNAAGRLILARNIGSPKAYDLAVFTTDADTDAAGIIERYARRWAIEPANATGKQLLGVGQARNRVKRAVERTVPFAFLVQTLVTIWYATNGYHPEDLTSRHAAEPWYQHKTDPSFEDMLAKLRRTIIASRFIADSPAEPDPHIIHDYALACAAAAA